MSHLRIFDNPKQAGKYPPLDVQGFFAPYVSEAAYEGRLQIVNNIGDCGVTLLTGTLPPGYNLVVDNDTSEVVLTWPEYQGYSDGDTSIPNASFVDNALGWDMGAGMEAGDWEWIYDGSDNNQQSYDNDDRSVEYHAGFRGNSRVMSTNPRACLEGTSVTAACQVQQGPSDANHTGGWVLLQFLDASRAVLETHEGNHIDSGSNAEWHASTVTAVAPAGTAFAVVGGECYRTHENKPMWLDAFSWNLPAADIDQLGTNGEDDIPLSLRVFDSAGRKADWSGVIRAKRLVIYVGSASLAGANVPLTVVDGATDTVTATLTGGTGDQKLYPSLSSDGTRVYHYTNNQLSYTDLLDNTTHVLTSGTWINGGPVLCDSTDTYLWALDFDDALLRKIRIADGVEVATYATVQNCTRMCWKDDTKTVLYVIPYTGDNLREFNTGTSTWGAGHAGPGEGQQFGLCVSPVTGYVYGTAITGIGGHLLTEYRPGLSYDTSTILPADTYNGTAITPDGSKVYVHNTSVAGKLTVIDVATHSVLTTISVGNSPNFVAINEDGSQAYVSCADATLWVIDTATDTVVDTVSVGTNAHGVAVLN